MQNNRPGFREKQIGHIDGLRTHQRTEKQWGKLLQEGRREWMDIIMEFTKAVAEADDLQEATEEQREVGWKGKC